MTQAVQAPQQLTIQQAANALAVLATTVSNEVERVRAHLTEPADAGKSARQAAAKLVWQAKKAVQLANGGPSEAMFLTLADVADATEELGDAFDKHENRLDEIADAITTCVDARIDLEQRVLAAIELVDVPQLGSPSFGFEYQLSDVKVVTEDVPSKTLLKRWLHNGAETVRLEVDGDDLEFITAPVTTLLDLNQQLTLIENEIHAIEAVHGELLDYAIPQAALDDETGAVVLAANSVVRVRRGGRFVHGKVQATTGRTLDQVTDLLQMYVDEHMHEEFAIIDAGAPVGNAAHLLRLVRYYIVFLSGGSRDRQGPKVLLPVMSRTDFHSAYLRLTPAEQTSFRLLIDYQGQYHSFDVYRATRISPIHGAAGGGGGYKGPAGNKYEGPTIGQWLDSIVDGDPTSIDEEPLDRDNDGEGPRGSHRDLLSPPAGYPAHRKGRHFTYAMGRFGTAADGAMLFELRAIEADTTYNVANMCAVARRFINLQLEPVATRHGRVLNLVQPLVTSLEQGGYKRSGFVNIILRRLKAQLSPAELKLAANLAGALIAALPKRQVQQTVKRKREDRATTQLKKRK
jgi:hypothetical protein